MSEEIIYSNIQTKGGWECMCCMRQDETDVPDCMDSSNYVPCASVVDGPQAGRIFISECLQGYGNTYPTKVDCVDLSYCSN